MTECERLISEGIFSKEFFNEEKRCDFFVDTQRKKIWAIELDLLLKFDAVCKKHNFRYFLMYGSLLGAVRHNGFIPWDDDLDVAMPRDDYEKFLSLSDEFHSPYFLQTPYTDNGYYFSFAKLRNTNTTAISKMFIYQPYNKGIFLDIFPIDNFIDDKAEERYEKIKYLGLENSTYMRMSNPNLDSKNLERVKNYSGRNPLETFEEIQKLSMEPNNCDTEKVILGVWTVYKLNKMVYNREDISDTKLCDFEGFKFPIPIGAENVLSTLYGDYLQLPPVEQRGCWHDGAIFNPDRSYMEYLPKK